MDLPGLARVALEGQPRDVPQRTRDVARSYAGQENALILAVVACAYQC